MNKKQFDAETNGQYVTREIAKLKGWDVLDAACSEKPALRAAQVAKLQAKHPIHVINVVWAIHPERPHDRWPQPFSASPYFAIYRDENRVMGVVESAIEHLRAKAVVSAEKMVREAHANLTAKMVEVNWELDRIAAYPSKADFKVDDGKFNYYAFREAEKKVEAKRLPFLTFFNKVKIDGRVPYGDDGIILEPSQENLDREIEFAVKSANYQFDAYLFKMLKKIGAAREAVLRDPEAANGLWGESFLHITLEDGTKQVWKTQQIVNCSVLGNYFYQWPTRLMK